jgi:DNA polymerase III alpha subunit
VAVKAEILNNPQMRMKKDNSGVFFILTLSDPSGTIDLFVWNNVAANYKQEDLPKTGEVYIVKNVLAHTNNYEGIKEWRLKPINDSPATDFAWEKSNYKQLINSHNAQ